MPQLRYGLAAISFLSCALACGVVGCTHSNQASVETQEVSTDSFASNSQVLTAPVYPEQSLSLQKESIKGIPVYFYSHSFSSELVKIPVFAKYAQNIGVCLLNEQGQMLFGINAGQDFAIMSTYKFAVSYALAKYATAYSLSLEQTLKIDANTLTLHEANYSPLREQLLSSLDKNDAEGGVPFGASFEVSLATLIDFAVGQSDSMASDLLAEFMGGWDVVNQMLGTDFKHYELELAQSPELSYDNYQSPLGAVRLLRAFAEDNLIDPVFKQQILSAMLFAPTGSKRIQAGVKEVFADSAQLQVFDKTGTGAFLKGKRIAVNDLAMIKVDGKTFYLSVFYKDIPDAKNYEGIEEHMQQLVAVLFNGLKDS